MNKRRIWVLLALLLIFSLAFSSFASIKASEQKLKNLKERMETKQEQIDETYQNQQGVERDLRVILSRKLVLEGKIKENNLKTKLKEAEIKRLQETLVQAKADIKEQQADFSERLRVMYMQDGMESNLSLLLTSKSIEDFLMNSSYMQNIVDFDKETLKKLNDKQIEIEKLEIKAKQSLEELRVLQVELENDKKELTSIQATLAKRNEELKALTESYRQDYAKMRSEEESIKASIAEEKRKAEELRKAREAQARKAGRPTGSFSFTVSKGWAWPTPTVTYISSPFGWRADPFTGASSFHNGTDLAGPAGSPIVATKSGLVIASGFRGMSGNYVTIDHGDGTVSHYAHGLSRVVKAGDVVKKGQLIMYMGSTGYSTGSHLHFTVFVNGQEVDSMSFFR
ncbi:murein hydrolase activator EnvC family protein [Guggenheimella bovis]